MGNKTKESGKLKKLKRYQYERYAILCRLAYPLKDNEPNYHIEDYQIAEVHDRWGRVVARIFWQAQREEVIVVFRGSQNLVDWAANLAFFPIRRTSAGANYRVHAGYMFLLRQRDAKQSTSTKPMSVEQSVMRILEPMLQQGKRVTFTGHSSGGAMAVLLADKIERSFKGKVKRVVTFGQPSTGLYSFKREYLLHKKTFRVCCGFDAVTYMPPLPSVYWHVGRMLWLHEDQIYENTHAWFRFSKSLISWLLMPLTYHYMRKYIRSKDLFDEH